MGRLAATMMVALLFAVPAASQQFTRPRPTGKGTLQITPLRCDGETGQVVARSFRHTNLRFELKAVGLNETQLVCDDWGAHDLLLLPTEEGKGNRAMGRFPLRSLVKGKVFKAWVEFICKVVLE